MTRIGIDYTAAARQRAGIGRYTRELVTALLSLETPAESAYQYMLFAATGGLDAEAWRPQPEPGFERQAETRGVRLRTVPLTDEWLARLWHRLRLPLPVEMITGPLDLFYSPDFVLPPTRRATRTLLTVHDLSFLRYPEAFVPSLLRYLERVVPRSVARADLVLADSAHTRCDLISLLDAPPERVQVLYSGVGARFRPGPGSASPRPPGRPAPEERGERERLGVRYGLDPGPYVLSVGTLQPRKNYVRLMRAFSSLPATARGREPQLVIAGGRGWLYQDIFAEAEKHGDRVRILGFVDDADLPALYRNAALLALPSLYEGFGLPVLEAMSCGTPVVCSNASSLPEVAGDAALLVDPFDVDGWTRAIARVLEDVDLRRGMVARGLAQAARFTWERAARQLLAAFDRVGACTPRSSVIY